MTRTKKRIFTKKSFGRRFDTNNLDKDSSKVTIHSDRLIDMRNEKTMAAKGLRQNER